MTTIPEAGEKFRLVSADRDDMLCEGTGTNGTSQINIGHRNVPDTFDFEDGSWWTLEHSDVSEYYFIKHVTTGLRMYANYERSEEGLTEYSPPCDDQRWKICPNPNKGSEFQLINRDQDATLFLRDQAGMKAIGLYKGPIYRDQYFCFAFEPVVKSIEYDLNAARLLGKTPKLVAQMTYSNDTDVDQQQEFRTKYTQTQEHRWEYSGGFKITAEMGMTFKAGIPLFVEAETSFKIGVETEHRWTNTNVETESEERHYTFPVDVPARKTITAKVLIHEERGEVPYEMVIGYKGSSETTKSYGKWVGGQSVNVFTEISQS